MKQIARRFLWLPLLVLALAWTAWPALSDEPAPERQLTTDTNLVGLAWGPEGLRVAEVRSQGGADWVRLAPEAPSQLAPAVAPPNQLPPGVELRQDGPHVELYLEGRLILATDFEAVGRPALSPDGQWLVVSRGPMGAGTAALSELWRYDVAADSWTRLTYNNLEESSPAISPDGSEIAFLRDGSLWIRPATADAQQAVSPAVPPADLSPAQEGAISPQAQPAPPMIRVVHVEENTCRPGVEVGEVVTIPLEAYLPGVLRTETIMSWRDEALKANAVAERSYAWSLILSPKYPADAGYDIKDWTHDQAYCECWLGRCGMDDPYYARASQIVAATAGQYIAHDGPPSYYSPVVRAFYGADNSSPTTAIPGNPVFQAIDDPPSFGSKLSGHGWGMGQWNSQRWALEGWSYIQILRHFYSNTTIEQAAGTDGPPLFDFDRPWHGRYLTGSGLFLTANATGVGQPVTAVEFRAGWPGGGWRITDTVGSDGWSALLDLRPIPDLSAESLGTALRVAGTALDAAGRQRLEQGPDGVGILVGIDRQPPTLAATLVATNGVTATLNISANDAGPSGVGGVGWSRGWLWEENHLSHAVGAPIEDSAAVNCRALEARIGRDSPGLLVSGPSFGGLPPSDLYRAWFRLRTDKIVHPDEVAILEVVDSGGSRLLGVKRLRGADFRAADQYQEFFVDFDYRNYDGHPAPSGGLEFRVRWLGGANLVFDRVLVTTWPRQTGSTIELPIDPGEIVTLKATDVAGNASNEVFVTRSNGSGFEILRGPTLEIPKIDFSRGEPWPDGQVRQSFEEELGAGAQAASICNSTKVPVFLPLLIGE